MPPKSLADVASAASTPDLVCSPSLRFSGGAHDARAATRSAEAVSAVTPDRRDLFTDDPSHRWADQTLSWLSIVGTPFLRVEIYRRSARVFAGSSDNIKRCRRRGPQATSTTCGKRPTGATGSTSLTRRT